MRPLITFTDGVVLEGTTPKQGILEEGAAKPSTMETTQTSVLERRPATSPEKPTAPLAEEPDIPATASGELAAVLTRELAAPPNSPEADKKVEKSLAHEFSGWTEIHLSHLVTPVGQVPSSLGDLRQHHQSHSSSRRRAQCCHMEEQRSGGQQDSSSALSYKSPMPIPSLGDPPKVPLPDFREISQSSIRGQPP